MNKTALASHAPLFLSHAGWSIADPLLFAEVLRGNIALCRELDRGVLGRFAAHIDECGVNERFLEPMFVVLKVRAIAGGGGASVCGRVCVGAAACVQPGLLLLLLLLSTCLVSTRWRWRRRRR